MDLRVAARRGLLVLPVSGIGRAYVSGRVLRYDPNMSRAERRRAVVRAMKKSSVAQVPVTTEESVTS